MIILHGGHTDERLFLWGEIPETAAVRPSERRGRKAKILKSKPYPYDAGIEGLARSLGEISTRFKPLTKQAAEMVAWLPTRGDHPVPSSPLIAETSGLAGKTKLKPWIIASYQLSIEETVDILCLCMGRRTLAAGVVVGADLAYWADVLRFAGSLVAKQQYLPGLTIDGNECRATWEPVFSGSDAERLAQLAKRMPPVARALSQSGAISPPETPAVLALRKFIAASLDYLVRSAATEKVELTRGIRKKKPGFDTAHDAWLHALRAPDGIFETDKAELAQLEEQLLEWFRPIVDAATSPFRLCFRLEEPEGGEGTVRKRANLPTDAWHVLYLLQPHDDPSLLVPVEDAWKPRRSKVASLMRYGSNVREFMLSSLGQAAGICPRIAASLETAEPAGYALDSTGAHEFLTMTSIALKQAGYGVMLPAWWTGKGTKVRLSIRANVRSPKMQGGSGLTLEQIVRFDWEVALGNKKLTLRELENLAMLKVPLVRVRGQWVEMNASEIKAAIEFWKNKASGEASVRDIIQMAVGAKDAPGGFEFEGISASGWIGKLLNQLDGRSAFKELTVPKSFSGTLRPYQVRGYSWLSFLRKLCLGACLADDMGLGKTIQTLVLIQSDWAADDKRPVLLVCPTSVVNNWQKEASRFTPELPVLVHHGISRTKGSAFKKQAQKHAIVVSSYGLLQRDIKFLQDVPWAGVVLDEAQNIKNPETRQARVARTLKADYRIALTGTPVENNVGDLWSIMEFLNAGFLGTQTDFKRKFFIPIQAGRDPDAANRLKRITAPFILRRLKTDKSIISDLPDKMEMKVFCPLTKEQASLYAAVLKEAEEAIGSANGIQRKGLILGTLSKLKQVCNHPRHFLGDNSSIPNRSGKLTRLTEMLEEIIEIKDRALVFSQFAEMGEILRCHLQETFGLEVLFLHGGVPRKQRDLMVERFQNGGEDLMIFVLSLKAGGTGLNLTRSNHVFHFDRWWNPAVENQATDRVFRIGQTRNVQVHKFICAGTLEEKIDEMIERKKEVAEKIVGTGEGWLTEVSNDELKEIFALRKEAIGE